MAQVRQPDGTALRSNPIDSVDDVTRGNDWVLFAGVILLIAALWNIIDSLIAIFSAGYYQSAAASAGIDLPVTDTIETWGWAGLLISIIMLVVTFGVFAGATWARVAGVIVVAANMIFHMAFLATFPFWSLMIIGADAVIIYALIVHGRPSKAT